MTILTNEHHHNAIAKKEEPQSHRCEKCNKTFRMKTHMKIHSCVPEAVYSCDFCENYITESLDDLKLHLKSHVMQLENDCPVTNDPVNEDDSPKENESPNENNQTVKISNTLELQCDVCSKVFSTKYVLKRHKLLHSNQKNFSCEVCAKKFAIKSYYQKHIKIHTRDSPSFTCKDCGKQFSKEHFYNAHIATHLTDAMKSVHNCQECGKMFSQKQNLKKHLKTHTK